MVISTFRETRRSVVRQLLALTKALADSNRLRILLALRDGELCVCQLQDLLGLAPSSTSRHLSILDRAGLVRARRDGRWAYYRLAAPGELPCCAAGCLEWLWRAAEAEGLARADDRRLTEIRSLGPEEVARRQGGAPGCCAPAPSA
jgi:ArsR family transcriptional regulator